jgi:hypothetical protein
MSRRCAAHDILGQRLAGLFRAPCPPPDADDGADYYRPIVKLMSGSCVEVMNFNNDGSALELYDAVESPVLDLQPIHPALDCVGELILGVFDRNGTVVLHLESDRFLWFEDDLPGTLACLEVGERLRKECPYLVEALEPLFP